MKVEFDERLPRMPKEMNMATITRFYGPTDYIELQHEYIKKLRAELDVMQKERDGARQFANAWKASAKMHREDELAFEYTIWLLEEDLAKARKHIEFWQRAYDRAMKFSVNMAAQRDEARTELAEMRQAIEDASEGSLRGSTIRFFSRIVRERDEAQAVARRLLNDPVYHLRCINRQWEKEGYDDPFDEAFEEAMELKDKLP